MPTTTRVTPGTMIASFGEFATAADPAAALIHAKERKQLSQVAARYLR